MCVVLFFVILFGRGGPVRGPGTLVDCFARAMPPNTEPLCSLAWRYISDPFAHTLNLQKTIVPKRGSNTLHYTKRSSMDYDGKV